eukprot:TRINITY_DN27426_c0_g1_i1.p1 TRINITY_DN27426_c0_g1~~TRINITY_DN27426_c0_g1_i1.p1  ORF type:complete len:479 (-),score=156.94 TRINITY_DN27426_c0_g1_i1:204-1640(-)
MAVRLATGPVATLRLHAGCKDQPTKQRCGRLCGKQGCFLVGLSVVVVITLHRLCPNDPAAFFAAGRSLRGSTSSGASLRSLRDAAAVRVRAAGKTDSEVEKDVARLGLSALFVQNAEDSRRQRDALEEELGDFAAHSPEDFREKSRQLSRLRNLVDIFDKLSQTTDELKEAEELAKSDAAAADDEEAAELLELAAEEVAELKARREDLQKQFQLAMLPTDALDEAPSVIVEIRPGVGGEEAALWAGDLMKMYTKFCEAEGLSWKVLEVSKNEGGGVTEASLQVVGEEVYSKLKFESGVHRVQRVPATEVKGRVHTSTATVAIMPTFEDEDVDVNENDLDFQFCRSGGPGGQNVNKVETGVHCTHKPTGLHVKVTQERSQLMNKQLAIKLIAAKLAQADREEKMSKVSSMRKSQVGTGGRSEKIRSYNYKENRASDHRLNENFPLSQLLDGNLQETVRQLRALEQQERLQEFEQNLKGA